MPTSSRTLVSALLSTVGLQTHDVYGCQASIMHRKHMQLDCAHDARQHNKRHVCSIAFLDHVCYFGCQLLQVHHTACPGNNCNALPCSCVHPLRWHHGHMNC